MLAVLRKDRDESFKDFGVEIVLAGHVVEHSMLME
jgi:hypothetical protein